MIFIQARIWIHRFPSNVTPIVLDISSSDEEKTDEVIGTVVKKEVEASSGEKKERKIIWVVSGTADD